MRKIVGKYLAIHCIHIRHSQRNKFLKEKKTKDNRVDHNRNHISQTIKYGVVFRSLW